MKKIVKDISKLITSLTVSAVISFKISYILQKYCKNPYLLVAINIASCITTWTLTDVIIYLVECAYEHGELTLCETAGLIDNIRSNKIYELNKE